MNEEMEGILAYLAGRKDYLIWAGFCVYAYLKMEPSPDVDIFTKSKKIKEQISSDFQNKEWNKIPHQKISPNWDWDQLKKNETTLDIVYSPKAAELFFSDIEEIKINNYELQFLSREWLYLTKLGQLMWKNRSKEKKEKDLKTIRLLKENIDSRKIKTLSSKLPASFWKTGEIQR